MHREKGFFLSVYVDDIKLAGKKQNMNPMWKVPNKEVDMGEPTFFLIMYTWDALEDNVKFRKDTVDKNMTILNPKFPQEQRKITMLGKSSNFFIVLMIWRVMQRNVWSDVVRWQAERLNNSTQYQLRALMTIICKEEELKS